MYDYSNADIGAYQSEAMLDSFFVFVVSCQHSVMLSDMKHWISVIQSL